LLQELSEAQGEILDNLELIETLENTKAKSIEISEKLVLATGIGQGAQRRAATLSSSGETRSDFIFRHHVSLKHELDV
jgi:hypothetical protein